MASFDKALVWYDPEGDFMEVVFDESQEGDMIDTGDDRIKARVNDQGNIIGFMIMSFGTLRGSKTKPFEVDLKSRRKKARLARQE